MKFLRTASTARLLTAIGAVLATIAACTAIAVAATSGGPVPAARSLPSAIHSALSGSPVTGVSADITFTDNLIDSSDFTGRQTDPLLQGASGRLWWSDDGQLRIELQSDNGDSQIVVDHRSFWISDPAQGVVYEGTLPAGHSSADGAPDHGVPTVTAITSELNRLMQGLDISAAQPTDVAGQPAYQVSVSPKTNGGLLGSVQLAFDAAHGVPLSFSVYATGDSQPVLAMRATQISFGPVTSSVLAISPPAGARVVQLGTLGGPGAGSGGGPGTAGSGHGAGSPASAPSGPGCRSRCTRPRVPAASR